MDVQKSSLNEIEKSSNLLQLAYGKEAIKLFTPKLNPCYI